jgi:hypothetical protein
MRMTFTGILMNIRNTFDKRNYDAYDILRYSHQHSKYLRQKQTRMRMTFSGNLIDIRNAFRQEKRECVWHSQVITLPFGISFDRRETKMRYCIFRYSRYLWIHYKIKYYYPQSCEYNFSHNRMIKLKLYYGNKEAKYLIPNISSQLHWYWVHILL